MLLSIDREIRYGVRVAQTDDKGEALKDSKGADLFRIKSTNYGPGVVDVEDDDIALALLEQAGVSEVKIEKPEPATE